MKTNIVTIAAALTVALIAGCGGGSTPATTTALSGNVADGYLEDATVFLDKNLNYQLDAGELKTFTDANGAYTLNVDPADVGKYPIVAMALAGVTKDKDTNAFVASSYVLCLPALAVSGTVNSNFISPMSTLIREKLEANPGMTLTEAMTQLRNQMDLAAGTDMMADYVAGSGPGMMNADQYQAMHANAQKMADLMASQAALVMNGSGVSSVNRYRSMMGTINSNMSAMAANATDSAFMTNMRTQMQTQLRDMQMSGFANYSGMFRNMTSHSRFWSNSGTPMTPMSGGMMR